MAVLSLLIKLFILLIIGGDTLYRSIVLLSNIREFCNDGIMDEGGEVNCDLVGEVG